jgi:hypothetical protein
MSDANADAAIAALDDALAEAGQDVVLRRVVGATNIDVKCRASVRNWRLKEEQIEGGVATSVKIIVISPTDVAKAQWPGGSLPGQTVDPSIPRRNDKLIFDGRVHNVEAVAPYTLGNQTVRYELEAL